MKSIFRRFNLVSVFILWRLILFIPLIVGIYLILQNKPGDFTYIYNPLSWPASFDSLILFPWANFDGIHYINIAQYGYINQARFFPLFPLVITIFTTPFINILNSPLAHFFTGLVLVNLIFLAALWIFRKLVKIDFPDKVAEKGILYFLIFPTAFFFVSIYSEGLFLLLALLSFYFARKRMWFLSIICVMLLMATRFVGVAILPALLYEFLKSGKVEMKKLLLFLLAPLGLAAYALFNFYKWDNFLYFIQSQGELGNNRSVNSVILFPQTIFRYIKILFTVPIKSLDWSIALLELGVFLFVAIMLFIAWKKKIRTSYLIFAAINFAIITATGTFSGLPRYILTIFPIFIAMALIENKYFKFFYIIISPVLLFILLLLFSRGYYVA